MDKLFNFLKNYTIQDAILYENQDRQFLVLKNLYENKKFDDELYLLIIVINSLISYQLSGKGENWWEEFAVYAQDYNLKISNIYYFFENLLKNCKSNKRFVSMKLKRVKKILDDKNFIEEFLEKYKIYYDNMNLLLENLVDIMNQRKTAKTLVFAIKMFGYGARNVFGKINLYPFDIMIPVDSRLTNLYKLNFEKIDSNVKIQNYYFQLSKKLNISPLHLDSILWVGYENLIEKLK